MAKLAAMVAVYALMIAVSAGCASLSARYPLARPSLTGTMIPNPIGLLIPIVLFGFIAGFQHTVGDTPYYRDWWASFIAAGKPKATGFGGGNTLMPYILSFAGKFNELFYNGGVRQGQIFILVLSLLYLIPALLILWIYAGDFGNACYFFMATGTYFAAMNGLRQYAATGILLLGTHFFLHPKLWKGFLGFLPFVLLAYTLHSSALIMIPLFFAVRLREFSWWTVLMVIGSVGCVLLSSAILPGFLNALEGTDYQVYSENGWFTGSVGDTGLAQGGASALRALVSMAVLILVWLHRSTFRRMGLTGRILINCQVVQLSINIISTFNWIFQRLNIYLYIFQVLLLCFLFRELVRKYGRNSIWNIGGKVCFAVYAYLTVGGNVTSYHNVWLPWTLTL
ncbi:MAG: EpsG family protein [Oscillospiraceae bacterium]|jgi:transmembrane protein EpsG|nr:EpsG family protein [Oscillospiraceae bacterium]